MENIEKNIIILMENIYVDNGKYREEDINGEYVYVDNGENTEEYNNINGDYVYVDNGEYREEYRSRRK